MPAIVLATADDVLRTRMLERLRELGRPGHTAASWSQLVERVADPGTRLVLLDAALPDLDDGLLKRLSRSLAHKPRLRVLEGQLEAIKPVKSQAHLARLVARAAPRPIDDEDRALLKLIGMGEEAEDRVVGLALGPLPIRVQGERGTGKQWVARLMHRIACGDAPFVVKRRVDGTLLDRAPAGTVYIEHVDRQDPDAMRTLIAQARATGWRVAAGSRHAPDEAREGVWANLSIKPLRDNPDGFRPLARLYLDRYRRRLGLPHRRIHSRLWHLMERYEWPGNHRELESFVVLAATSGKSSSLAPGTLPKPVLERLEPGHADRARAAAFERVVEERLRPIVRQFADAPHDPDAPTLHRLVLDATERALLRLALQQTGSNQRAAATLLGIARNTLRKRLERLDPFG